MNNEVKKWITIDGLTFLRKIGMKKGDFVVDFGCGKGHYSIPAAKIVSKEGKIYAIEKDKNTLKRLKKSLVEEGLHEIITLLIPDPDNILKINLADNTADFLLVYDVLHYFTPSERNTIYKEYHRILKRDGILSVFPKHTKSDWPIWNLAEMEVKDVIQEIIEMGFQLIRKQNLDLFHDEGFETGNILEFTKTSR